ncbi:MAG TPA: hypothetical protein VFM53_07710 [Anaeromyxobacteraceae bacterium]|nr:hypothetical protein [Anaeromyxobacteraceae bacterium]
MNAPAQIALAVALVAASAAGGAACTPRPPPVQVAGRLVAAGPATGLSASPDGSRIAWLGGCAPGGATAAPASGDAPAGGGAVSCALQVAAAAGGDPARVADGVAPGPAPYAWGPDGSVAALSRRTSPSGAGVLTVMGPDGKARVASPAAVAFALGSGGALAVAEERGLRVEAAGREPAVLAGGAGATEVAFAPGASLAVAARVRGADGSPSLLMWRDGAGAAAVVARDVGAWAFSPDGRWLAAQAGMLPGSEGVVVVVPVAAPGAAPPVQVVARGAGEFRWGPAGAGLGWLESFDPRIRSGVLVTGRPGEAPLRRGDRVTAWEVSPGGEVASVRHAVAGGYSAILELTPPAGGAPVEVARDPAGMAFGADGRWLWYRAACSPSGDACALFRVKAGGGTPEQVADAVVAFALDPVRSDRALVTTARRDGQGGDLGLWTGGRIAPLDGPVVPGSAVLAGGPAGGRAAWISSAPGRSGVRIADLP